MTAIRLKLFGGFEGRLPDGSPLEIGTRKAQALLAFLACRPGEAHTRDRLAAMFWGDGDDRAARHSLRQALASLRRAFPAGALLLETGRGNVGLEGGAVDGDVAAFEELGRSDSAVGLAAAADLYRGPLLDGFAIRAEPFEEWLAQERSRLHERAVAFSLRLAELASDDTGAAQALLRAVELDPLNEEAHRRLMRLHLDNGRCNSALRQYRACRELLWRDLGAAPEPSTEALYREAVAASARDVPMQSARVRADGETEDARTAERKQVTVLCATLLPASPGGELGDPEETQDLLGPVLERLKTIAVDNCGKIIGESGDEIIAVFGAPLASENHAADACDAASQMASFLASAPSPTFVPSIAIDSGEAVVRTRDESLAPAGVFGDCLRRAARLARSGFAPLCATEATFAVAKRFWRFAPIPAESLDPQTSPVTLYLPLGPERGDSSLDHFPASLTSRFIGRVDEYAALTAALAPAAAGRGRLVAIVGEPGIGKSRLAHEFIRGVPEEWRVVVCRGDPQLAEASYLPIAQAVRSCLGLDRRARSEQTSDELLRAVRALDPTLEPDLPAFASLLDLAIPDPVWDALEPAQKRQRIIGVATQVFAQAAKRRPLLFVIEDLHWLDPASRLVLERLVERLPSTRTLLMVNYRTEFAHSWGGRSFYRQISVGPLSVSTVTEFVDALLGNDPSIRSLRERLIASTGGNPFFIEECVRSLAHSGAIAGTPGAFAAERDSAIALPQTVQAVIAARIDQLAATDRTLLRIAAVIGNEVPYELLCAVSDLDVEALRAGLGRLQAAEFLVDTGMTSNPTYRFKHALTNEVAYATLLLQTRREMHARILAVLEHQHAGRLEEHLEALAYHAGRGEVFERALDYGRRAGFKAVGRAAYRAALAHFGQALSALGQLPETRSHMTQEIDLRFELRNAHFVLGEHDFIIEHLQRAEALAEQTGDGLRRGYAALYTGGWFWYLGRPQLSREAGERALTIGLDLQDVDLTALAWYRIGQSHHASGHYRAAIDGLQRSTSMLESAGRTELMAFGGYPFAFCCSFLAWSFAELGAFATAREWGLRGWRFANERNHTYTKTVTTFGLGSSYVREGRYEDARQILERGLELSTAGDGDTTFSWVASPLGFAYVALGKRETGIALLQRALTFYDRPILHRARLQLWLADAYLLAGLGGEAAEAASRAKVLAEGHGEQAHVAWAERVLGDVAAPHDPAAAHRHYTRAIDIARPLELCLQLTPALLGRTRLLRASGDVREADALSAEATSLAGAMGA